MDIYSPDVLENGLDGPLHGVEVHVLAVGAQGEHLGLVGQAVLPAGQIDPGQLIEPGGLVAVVVVAGEDIQHGGQGGGAHDGGVLPQRVEDLEALAGGVVAGPADLVIAGGGDEGVGDDLVIPEGAAERAQPVFQLLLGGVAAQGGLAPHKGDGDVVVPVEPGHLLGQIGDALHVGAPGGDDHVGGAVGEVVLLGVDLHPLQIFVLLRGGDVGTQQGIHPLRIHADGAGLGYVVEDVDDAVHHLAGSQQLHQLAGPLDGGEGVHGIQALFELGAGLGAHAQGQGTLADAGAVEAGGLEHHVGGVGDDLAVLAAHDARKAHGPGLVGDDQVVGIELAHLAVQGGQLLALLRPADDDSAALHIAVVEGVHGLAVLQHDVVGDIHDVVDGTHAHGAQPLPHPLGGGGDLHVAYHPGGVPGHQVGRRGLHVQQLGEHAGAAALHHRLVEGERGVVGGGHLPGQADDGQAVGPVGGDLKLHYMVVGVDDGLEIVAGLAVLAEDEDAVWDAVGEFRLLGVKVVQGTVAAGLGVVGHKVACVQVGAGGVRADRAGSDVRAGVEGAVRLGLTLQYPGAHHGAVDLVAGLNVGGDGGLVLVQGLVVPQNGGGGDGGIGEVPLVQAQLGQTAKHAVGQHAAQLALLDLLAAG